MTTMQQSVVDLLVDQHREIKALFNKVAAAKGERRRALFDDLVRLLAVHESAEEVVVHPAVRNRIEAGSDVVERRLHEENEAKHALAELYDLGVDHRDFDRKLAALKDLVLAHADNEVAEEFAVLGASLPREELVRLARAFEAAQSIVPTRPHVMTGESAIVNLVAGPPLAVYDRIRDALHEWRQSYDNLQQAARARAR